MAIRRLKRKRKLNAEINVVPYIDVMMVLLVIFMITAPMLTQGVDVELPQANADPVEDRDKEPVIVTVDHQNLYYIDIGDDPTQPVAGAVIQERVRKVLAANPEQMLLVKGDKRVAYEQVVRLMVLLQQAGAEHVGLITE